jgi:phosphatidate cytidylyltransferase
MKRVLTAAVLIPVVLLIVFKAPLWLFSLVVAAIIVLALREYLNIAEAAGIKPFRWLAYVAALLPLAISLLAILFSYLPLPSYFSGASPFFLIFNWYRLALLAPVLLGLPLVFRKDLQGGLASAASSAFGVFYIGASLSVLVVLRDDVFDPILIVFILFSVWAGDIAAYYVGKNFGRHKLAPVVSPNKSWEGAVASVLASVAVAILVLHYRHAFSGWFSPTKAYLSDFWILYQPGAISPIHAITLGVLTNVAAQFGDLFESALKRSAGIKDSGALLPGHGGLLDRIDALLFAIPVVWYYASLTGFLHPKPI